MAEEFEGPGPANTTVQVAVRCRPLSEKEIREGGTECVEIGKDGQTITLNPEGGQSHQFAFDHVFGKNSTQPQVFETLGNPLLDKAFEGYNATIFAYGQTGSGKTHTMMSDRKSDDRGLIPRISEGLFERIGKLTTGSRKFLVCCSFLEIYNEIVYDLLVPRGKSTPKTGLEIREQKGIGVYVKDLQEIVVENSEKLQKLIDQGFEHRATSATNMNATSSRSHCLFIIKMHQKDEENASNNNFSKMNLVDLAGSERAAKTGAQGDVLKEGANINKSLSSLGNVINALSKMASGGKKGFIPYRDSKLTRVLQESLGGNALTTMMAALSPSKTNCDETLSTLNYAKRAKTIKVNAQKNEESEQIARLEEEVQALREKLAAQATGAVDTSKYESQIEEMERFMKQTWEDKEQASRKHEEERKALEEEAKKSRERAIKEREKSVKLLEERADLALTVQEFRSHGDIGNWTACSSTWPAQVGRLMSLEQKVSSQCRAVLHCRDAVLLDLDSWCEQHKASDEDQAGVASRMLLQQAERKAASMLLELDVLEKEERELEDCIALLLPEVSRLVAGMEAEKEMSKKKEAEKADEDEAIGGVTYEEMQKVLSLFSRQLANRQVSTWGRIAEDHRGLGALAGGINKLLDNCGSLGVDASSLRKEFEELEKPGESISAQLGSEASAALIRPLGLCDGRLQDAAISASSHDDAVKAARLLGGVLPCTFGGWCPDVANQDQFIQVDLGAPHWLHGLCMQGRSAACGDWKMTRPLVAMVIEPDPLPPEKVFKRPPVRLIHDVVVAAFSRHKALCGQTGKADFTADQLDYKKLANRQDKVDFFELLVQKLNDALPDVGLSPQNSEDLIKITPADILGGKNTAESNRMLQVLCYLALQKKFSGNLGGLLMCSPQWVTKYKITWSNDGSQWTPLKQPFGAQPDIFDGNSDATKAQYNNFRTSRPPQPARYVRIHPVEWSNWPGLRLEVYGWPEATDIQALQAANQPKGGSGTSASLTQVECSLEVVRRKAESLRLVVKTTSAAAAKKWKEAQAAEAEKNAQVINEKTQVEQKLAHAMKELEELRKGNNILEEKVAESEQKLVDAAAEKLKLEVDKERSDNLAGASDEKLQAITELLEQEQAKVVELEARDTESKNMIEEMEKQIGVLNEERDAARANEEEYYESLQAREEELMNTNEGYCTLTDQLNETREEYDDKLASANGVINNLTHMNQDLQEQAMDLRSTINKLNQEMQVLKFENERLKVQDNAAKMMNGAKVEVELNASPPKKKKQQHMSNGHVATDDEYGDDFEDE